MLIFSTRLTEPIITSCTVQGYMSHLWQTSGTQVYLKVATKNINHDITINILHIAPPWSSVTQRHDNHMDCRILSYVFPSHFKTVLTLPEWGQVLSCSEVTTFDSIACQIICGKWPVSQLYRLMLVGFWLWSRYKNWFNS